MSAAKSKYDEKKSKAVTQDVTPQASATAQTPEQEAEKKRKRQSIFTAEGGSINTATNRGTVFGN